MASRWWVGLLVVVLSGCHSLRSHGLLQRAERSVEQARIDPQRVNHPYHYRKAMLFLSEARRADSRGEYELSADYAQKALSSSLLVRQEAHDAP